MKSNSMTRLLTILSILVFIVSCSSDGKRNPEYLPAATGKAGDVVIIIDSTQWNGPVGAALKKHFMADVPGLPRPEYLFNVINVHPSRKIELLKQLKSLIFVFTLDSKSPGSRSLVNGFTPETIQQIKNDTSYYIYYDKDLFARGQDVIYLFGNTEERLIKHIEEKGQNLVDYINKRERERLSEKFFSSKSAKNVADFLRKEHQCEMRLPPGYRIADQTNDFVWFRRIEPEADKDIFISWQPYVSQYQLLPDSLVAMRDKIAERYLFEDPEDPGTFLVTETTIPFIPVKAKQTSINGEYAMEIRGLWRTNNRTMGGPFVGYAVVDKNRGLLYYIEGFTYSPGKSQREIMRELETILWTFKTSDQLTPQGTQ